MRTALLLATFALLVPAARAQQPPQPAPAPAPARAGEAPSVPTEETPAQAAVPAPDSGELSKINVQGNRRVETDAIRAVIPLKPGDTYDRAKLKTVLLSVWRMGYFNDVKLDVSPAQPPLKGFTLTVLVSEKPAVREVRLEGNEELSKDDFKDTLEIKQYQILDQEAVRKSAKKIQEKYVEKGFFLAEVTPKIVVSGDLLEPREKLLSLVITHTGERFSKSRLQRDMQVLLDVYKDKGYAYANVTPDTAVDAEKKSVDLTYVFQKGNLVTIEKIEVVGNSKTRDKVIRREMRINEGDLYSGTGVRLSKQRVTALGFFDNVEINNRRGSGDDKMVLEVSVKEKLTGTFQIGFGFTGGESFFGQAQLAQNNLFGYGHTASLALQISSIRQLFQLSYLDPYLFDTPWTGSIDLYRSELIFSGFDRQANGFALTAGYEVFEDFRLFTTYTLEKVNVVASGGSNDLLANQFSSGRTSSIRVSFNYDRRDNRLFPTNGHLESASAEFAAAAFDSQNLFQRYRLIERFYRPIFWGLVFKVNLSLGYIRATDPLN